MLLAAAAAAAVLARAPVSDVRVVELAAALGAEGSVAVHAVASVALTVVAETVVETVAQAGQPEGQAAPVEGGETRTVTEPGQSIAVGPTAAYLAVPGARLVVSVVVEMAPEPVVVGIAEETDLADRGAPISAAQEPPVGSTAAQAMSYRGRFLLVAVVLLPGPGEEPALDAGSAPQLPGELVALEVYRSVASAALAAAELGLQLALPTDLVGSAKPQMAGA